MFCIRDFIDKAILAGNGARTAFITPNRNWTFTEISSQIDNVSDGLLQENLRQGDVILLALEDSIEFVVAFLAILHLGMIATPVSPYQSTAEYRQILEMVAPRLIFVSSGNSKLITAISEWRSNLSRLAVLVDDASSLWVHWTHRDNARRRIAVGSLDGTAFLLWTSGTTGKSRPVPHRQIDCLICCQEYASKVLSLGPDDTVLSTSRMFHAYGLGNSFFFPLFSGSRAVLLAEKPTPKSTLEYARAKGATVLFSVPTLLSMILEHSARGDHDLLPKLRLAVSASEPLAAGIVSRWKSRFGVDLLNGVGSTEALHIYVSSRPGEVRPGSVGKPVDGYAIELRENGRLVSPGELGTLWLRGPSLAPHYWNDENSTEKNMKDGWFDTGDRFIVDKDGYYHFRGRADSMFRISGTWVSAIEVENVLKEEPIVKDVAVVAYFNEDDLSKLCAFVVLNEGSKGYVEIETRLRQRAVDQLPLLARPTRIEFIDEIPRTVTGKVQRFYLSKRFPGSSQCS